MISFNWYGTGFENDLWYLVSGSFSCLVWSLRRLFIYCLGGKGSREFSRKIFWVESNRINWKSIYIKIIVVLWNFLHLITLIKIWFWINFSLANWCDWKQLFFYGFFDSSLALPAAVWVEKQLNVQSMKLGLKFLWNEENWTFVEISIQKDSSEKILLDCERFSSIRFRELFKRRLRILNWIFQKNFNPLFIQWPFKYLNFSRERDFDKYFQGYLSQPRRTFLYKIYFQ